DPGPLVHPQVSSDGRVGHFAVRERLHLALQILAVLGDERDPAAVMCATHAERQRHLGERRPRIARPEPGVSPRQLAQSQWLTSRYLNQLWPLRPLCCSRPKRRFLDHDVRIRTTEAE